MMFEVIIFCKHFLSLGWAQKIREYRLNLHVTFLIMDTNEKENSVVIRYWRRSSRITSGCRDFTFKVVAPCYYIERVYEVNTIQWVLSLLRRLKFKPTESCIETILMKFFRCFSHTCRYDNKHLAFSKIRPTCNFLIGVVYAIGVIFENSFMSVTMTTIQLSKMNLTA